MPMPKVSPSERRVDAAGLLAFVDAVEGARLHSLVVAREGAVIAQGGWAPYAPDRSQLVYSCSKSFTASAVGLLVDEGRIGLDDSILDHLPWSGLTTDRGALDDRWQRATIAHCLSMTLGHDIDAWDSATQGAFAEDGRPVEVDWLDLILRSRLDHEPGTTFTYNQVCTYLLSRVVTHVSGEPLLSFLRPRLLDPLGIGPVATQTDTAGHALGFTGMHVSAEALLRLAQLMADEGQWEGRRLLSAEWVRCAREPYGPITRDPMSGPDWQQGYGFSFWNARHGYRGDGAFGQFAIVLPEQRMCVGITAETQDMQAILDALWEHVLPAVDRPGSSVADRALAGRLSGARLELPDWRDEAEFPAWWRVAGPAARVRIPHLLGAECDAADLVSGGPRGDTVGGDHAGAEGWRLDIDGGPTGRHSLVMGSRWTDNRWTFPDGATLPLLARGHQRDGILTVECLAIDSPHRFRIVTDVGGRDRILWHLSPLSGPEPWVLCPRAHG